MNLIIHIHNQVSAAQHQPRPITLTAGHIFQGRITKLYPNNLAALSIKGMNLTAQLEAALTTGERYWFEVQAGTGIPKLRVLDDNQTRLKGDAPLQIEHLMEKLAIPKTKKMELFLRQLTEQQIPFTRGSVVKGAELLDRLNQLNQKGMNMLFQMMQRQLPITEVTYQAFQSVNEEPSLADLLQRLASQLKGSPATAELSTVISKLLKNDFFEKSSPLKNLLLLYSSMDEGSEEGQSAKQLLTRLGVMNEEVNKSEMYSRFQQAVLLQGKEQAEPLIKDPKAFFEAVLSRLHIPSGEKGVTQMGQLLRLLKSDVQPSQMIERLAQLPNEPLEIAERNVLANAIERMDQNGKTIGGHLRVILQMLGYQHEYDVSRFLQGEMTKEQVISDRLKALLLNAQQQDLPEGVKEQINKTILRLTGQQILTQEQGGVQQLIMQIPLNLGSFQTDMTMQWEGKKGTDGKLDPDYCRILFYLTLERLDEVIVDVQIQKRVITVSIFNEQEKPDAFIGLLFPSLKKRLLEQNYQLLSLKWEKMGDLTTSNQQLKNLHFYEGVDVRI